MASFFRRMLMLIVVALFLPVYFAVWRLFKVDSTGVSGRSRAFLRFKQLNHLQETPVADGNDSGDWIMGVGVKYSSNSTLSAIGNGSRSIQSKLGVTQEHRVQAFEATRKSQLQVPTKSSAKALEDKREIYAHETCAYLKTSKGLHRICIDKHKKDSRSGSTATVLGLVERVGKSPYEEHAKKPERQNAPPTSPPPGILYTTHWVAYRDPHNYKYLVNPSATTCMRRERVDLLVLVTSHPDNVEKRNVIRDTWGASNTSTSPGVITPVVKVRFLLGVTTLGEQAIGEHLKSEIDKHGDIVVEEFLESYLNLSVKTVMGLKWATQFCPDARYVMKTDDDIIVNIPRLLAHLQTAPRRELITGRLAKNFPALRNPGNKFYTPRDVYSEAVYPDYCVGLGYIMSIDVVHRLYAQALLTPLFPWEDVYIGLLLETIKITPKNISNFYYLYGSRIFYGLNIVTLETLSRLRSYYTLDGLTPEQTIILWSQW